MVKKSKAGKKLTEREKQALYLIRTFQYEKRYSPTQRYISKILGFSPAMANELVRELKQKGYIEMSPSSSPVRRHFLFPRGTVLPFGKTAELPPNVFPEFLTETLDPEKV